MDREQARKLMEENPIVKALAEEREILWLNPKLAKFDDVRGSLPLSMADVDDAEARLERFAPFIMKKFPETAEARGIIESELREAAAMTGSMMATVVVLSTNMLVNDTEISI